MVRIGIISIILFLLLGACTKEPERAVAFITVNTHQGFVVKDAFVNFYINSNKVHHGSIDTTLVTDEYGHVELVLYHECYLDALAIKTEGASTSAGTVSLRVIPGQTTSKTIVLR